MEVIKRVNRKDKRRFINAKNLYLKQCIHIQRIVIRVLKKNDPSRRYFPCAT